MLENKLIIITSCSKFNIFFASNKSYDTKSESLFSKAKTHFVIMFRSIIFF